MRTERFDLSGDGRVTLDAYLREPKPEMPIWEKRPAVVVCPGGGYGICSQREGDPIALSYLAAGFHAFVLTYSLGERAAFPQPLVELSQAMALIRSHAGEWGVMPDQIAVCGFSAGGHLTASLGVHWNRPEIQALAGVTGEENRPNALILGYPVITTSWMDHDGCVPRLVGDRDEAETRDLLNCQRHVGKHTPPAFLFHTYEDNCVPVEDSLVFASALAACDIPFELHIFEKGVHGLALGTSQTSNGWGGHDEPDFAKWMNLSVRWLWNRFGQPALEPKTGDFPRQRPYQA